MISGPSLKLNLTGWLQNTTIGLKVVVQACLVESIPKNTLEILSKIFCSVYVDSMSSQIGGRRKSQSLATDSKSRDLPIFTGAPLNSPLIHSITLELIRLVISMT